MGSTRGQPQKDEDLVVVTEVDGMDVTETWSDRPRAWQEPVATVLDEVIGGPCVEDDT